MNKYMYSFQSFWTPLLAREQWTFFCAPIQHPIPLDGKTKQPVCLHETTEQSDCLHETTKQPDCLPETAKEPNLVLLYYSILESSKV